MELLFVTILGAGIAAIMRYALPARHSYGLFLLPAVGAIVASIVWVALVWVGLTFNGGWIWLASLGLSSAASLTVGLLVPRRRHEADTQLLTRLSGSKA